MTIKHFRFVTICIAILGLCAGRVSAQILFSDNFNTDTSANWTVNKAPTATDPNKQTAQFAFDYSAFGIPPAPGSNDTLGLRLRANLPLDGNGNETTARPGGTLSGLSVSPTGGSFGTSYRATFYVWSNFAGAPNASGLADNAASEGGTNNILFAVGTNGTTPLVVGNTSAVTNSTIDGVAFATTGDGGITNDYRAYPATNAIGPTTLLAANSYANTNAYYTDKFLAKAAPAAQAAIASAAYTEPSGNNPMVGLTQPGAFGFAWHKVVIRMNNNSATWNVDDTLLATVDTTALSLGGSNFALGVSDVNTSTARYPSLVFTLFDNLTVTQGGGLPGDFNDDGVVGPGDYVIVKKYQGTNHALPNDNGLGVPIGIQHYILMAMNYGRPPGVGSGDLLGASVPEPSSLLLLIFSAGCCCWSARNRFVAYPTTADCKLRIRRLEA